MVKDNIDNYQFGELEINDLIVSHLHDKNGENWFDDNAGASLLGIAPRTYRDHVDSILNSSESFGGITAKNLKTGKRGRPRRFSNFGMIVMTASRSESDKAMGIVVLAGKLLNDMYNKVQEYTIQQDAQPVLEMAKQNIDNLKNKSNKERQLAMDSRNQKDFIEHTDLSDKYSLEAHKRNNQYKHALDSINKLEKDTEANQRGELTESGDRPVFFPNPQLTLDDFKHIKTDKGVGLVPKSKRIQSKIDKWMDSNTNKSFSKLAANVDRRREKQAIKKQRRLAKKNIKSQVTLI